jgi:C4-dicarboxylate transporter DctM subunit
MAWIMVLTPILLLALGVPIFLALLATCCIALVAGGDIPATALHQNIFGSLDKFGLIAVPFFIFAGDLLSRGAISAHLLRWVTALLGGFRGGLPVSALGTATVFSAISGSTAATVAAVGKLTYDRLLQAGYSRRFSSALLVSIAAIDNLIPPSIGFILYGIAADASIVRLFAAGILPGLVMGGCFLAYIYYYVGRHGEQRSGRFSLREVVAATRQGVWAISAPVVILGGIYAGVFSPTEAAGVACVYAIFVAAAVYRVLSWPELYETAARSMYLTAQIFLIVAVAGVYSWLLTVQGAAQGGVAFIRALDLPPWAVLLAINVLLLAVGMALDTASSILVLAPLLAPIAAASGVDPIHFGVIVVMNLSIGTFTPPFGINIFVAQAAFKVPLTELYPGLVPFIAASIVGLLVVTYVPWLSLWIPRLMN